MKVMKRMADYLEGEPLKKPGPEQQVQSRAPDSDPWVPEAFVPSELPARMSYAQALTEGQTRLEGTRSFGPPGTQGSDQFNRTSSCPPPSGSTGDSSGPRRMQIDGSPAGPSGTQDGTVGDREVRSDLSEGSPLSLPLRSLGSPGRRELLREARLTGSFSGEKKRKVDHVDDAGACSSGAPLPGPLGGPGPHSGLQGGGSVAPPNVPPKTHEESIAVKLGAELQDAVARLVSAGALPATGYPRPTVSQPSVKQRKTLGQEVAFTSPFSHGIAAAARKASAAPRGTESLSAANCAALICQEVNPRCVAPDRESKRSRAVGFGEERVGLGKEDGRSVFVFDCFSAGVVQHSCHILGVGDA